MEKLTRINYFPFNLNPEKEDNAIKGSLYTLLLHVLFVYKVKKIKKREKCYCKKAEIIQALRKTFGNKRQMVCNFF